MDREKSRFGIFTVVLIIFIVIFSLPSLGQTSRYRRKVDKSTLLYLFENQGFKHLNTKLGGFQKAYEDDYQEEDNLFSAFEVFYKADPSYKLLLDAWVKQFTALYIPYVARANYYCACAWEVQGPEGLRETDQKKIKEMERYFSLALLDIAKALKMNARLDVCYAMKVEIGMARGDEDLKNKALAEALKYHPYAYRVRLKYVYSLAPRWGGSYRKMEKFIDGCTKYITYNPKLKELSASIHAERGSSYYNEGKYEQAVKMYTVALNYSDHPSYYAYRGDAYSQLHDYKQALADYDQALELSPNDPDYQRRKEQVLSSLDRVSYAQGQNKQAKRLKPNVKWDQEQEQLSVDGEMQANKHAKKASEYARAGNYEEAIRELNEAIRLSPDEYTFYYNRAMYSLQCNNSESALQDFLHVVELNRDYVDSYIRITLIYASRNMYDEALNTINTAILLDPKNGEAFYYRGMIYEKKGMNMEALQEVRQACELGYQRACREYKQIR